MRLLLAPVLLTLAASTMGCGDGGGGGRDDATAGDDGNLRMPRLATQPCAGEVDDRAADLAVRVGHGSLARGEPVTWYLEVGNTGDEEVELVFFSGQMGDVTLSDGSGEVYRWSAARSFSQAVHCGRLGAGERRTITLGDDILEINPGDYRLEATVTSRPAPPPVGKNVRVGA